MRREVLRRSGWDSVTDWEVGARRAVHRVSALAKDCGISQRHLGRFLRLKFGKSPRKWLVERRLARGTALLRRPVLVNEASAEAGFKTPAHFTSRFTQQFGVPPSAIRHADAA